MSVYAYLEKPSMVDYPGRYAAVFFTSGCNFRCGFCHNATLMGRQKAALTWEQLTEAATRFKNNWVNGIVITGGEPTCSDDLVDLIRFFKERFGFAVKLDTNGSRSLIMWPWTSKRASPAIPTSSALPTPTTFSVPSI
jgi:pyruvate formate lyase activating enzyme